MSYYTDYSDYTDHHEVDEDLKTIAIVNGGRYQDKGAGQMMRDLYYVSDFISDRVASRCCTIQTKKNKHHSPSNEGE